MDRAGCRIGIAVSGGPDSVALLLLAHAALPERVEAATVDHGLRAESADEASFVAELCARLGVAHEIIRVQVGEGNLQSEARAARYEALGDWTGRRGLDALATAHHADDQAETVLMRLNRGSGTAGLSGIRAITTIPGSDRRLVRPLLTWSKADLQGVASASGIEPVRDPSNDDLSFDRVRVRQMMRQAAWFDAASIARSAELIALANLTLDRLALEELAGCSHMGSTYAYFPYRRRPESIEVMPLWIPIVQEMAARIGCPVGKAEAAALLAHLRRGKKSNVGGLEARAERRDGEVAWILAREKPRRG